jgi:hypothetical protein
MDLDDPSSRSIAGPVVDMPAAAPRLLQSLEQSQAVERHSRRPA